MHDPWYSHVPSIRSLLDGVNKLQGTCLPHVIKRLILDRLFACAQPTRVSVASISLAAFLKSTRGLLLNLKPAMYVKNKLPPLVPLYK